MIFKLNYLNYKSGLGNNEDTQKKLKTLFNLIEPAQKIILDTKKGIYTEIITLSKNLSALSNNLSDPKNKEIYNSFKSEFLNILNQYNLDITAAEQAEKEKIEKKKKITEDWNHELSSIDVNIFGNHKNEIEMALKTIKNGADLKKFLIFVVNKALNIDLNKEQNITQEQLKKASTALENCLIRFNNNNSERGVLKSYFNGVIQNIVINVAKIKKNIKSTEMLDIIKKEIDDSLTKDEIFSSQAQIEKKKKIKDTKEKKDQDKKIVKTRLESEEYKLEKRKKTEEKQKRKEEYEKKQQIAKDVKKNEGAEKKTKTITAVIMHTSNRFGFLFTLPNI